MLEAISAKEIAVSGLKAQRTQMDLIANNIANMLTTRTETGGPFRRQMAVFRAEELRKPLDPEKFGVRVKAVVPDMSPFKRVYEPGHPDADADGYVDYPNVDLSSELVNLVSAQRAYEANVAVITSDKRMSQKVLEILNL